MRAFVCLVICLVSGCTAIDASAREAEIPGSPLAPEATPLFVNGTIWVPPSGSERSQANVTFGLNATADIRIGLRVGSTLTPLTTADVVAELRGARASVLDRTTPTSPGLGPQEAILQAAGAEPGGYALHFAMWGGSDGSSAGDYIEYRIQAP